MIQERSPSRWMVTRGADLIWKLYEQTALVYNTASGDTHLLEPLAAKALTRIQTSPATLVELAGELSTTGTKEMSARLPELLRELNDLGLIEPQEQ